MPFYENYVRLCNSIDKSPSAVAIELKLGKPSVSRWKSGTVPRDATVQKIADYFGVTTSYLRGEKEPEEQKENPTVQTDSEVDERINDMWDQLTPQEREYFFSQIKDYLKMRGQ